MTTEAQAEFDTAGDSRRAGKAAPPPWGLFSCLKGGRGGAAVFTVRRDDSSGLRLDVRTAAPTGEAVNVSIRYDGPNDRTAVLKLRDAAGWTESPEALPHAGEPFAGAAAAGCRRAVVDADELSGALGWLGDAAGDPTDWRHATQALHVTAAGRLATTDGHRAHYVEGFMAGAIAAGGRFSVPDLWARAVLVSIKATRCRKVRLFRDGSFLLAHCAGPFLSVTLRTELMENAFEGCCTVLEASQRIEGRRWAAGDAAAVLDALKSAPVVAGPRGLSFLLRLSVAESGEIFATASDGERVALPLTATPEPETLGLSVCVSRDYLASALGGFVGPVRVGIDPDLFDGGRFSSGAVLITGRTADALDGAALVMPVRV